MKYNFNQDEFSPKQCYLKDEKTKEISDKDGVISGAKGCGMYTSVVTVVKFLCEAGAIR